jgi:gamma-glutamylcyclotransferase
LLLACWQYCTLYNNLVADNKAMYYFAYGTNLNKRQMAEHCPESRSRFIATLHNYRLIFTGWSRQWRGGVASIKPLRGEKVLGAIYEVSDRDLRLLDKHEGYPDTYNRIKVTLNRETGEPFEAITYIKVRQSEETKPSPEYLAVIQQGYRDWGLI